MYYYGNSVAGKKLHLGNYVLSGRGHADYVFSFCGTDILSWEQGERPPGSRVDEFCKNCLRTYAWESMTIVVTSQASNAIIAMVDLAQAEKWSFDEFSQHMLELAEELDRAAAIELPTRIAPPNHPAPVEEKVNDERTQAANRSRA